MLNILLDSALVVFYFQVFYAVEYDVLEPLDEHVENSKGFTTAVVLLVELKDKFCF